MWYSSTTRRDLFKAIRRSFPDRQLSYTYEQMRKIGGCVDIDHLLGLWWLRMDLRELAYDTWCQLRDEGNVQKSTRQDLIENDIIKSTEQLIQAITEANRIGATELFAFTKSPETYVDVSRLQRDLKKLRAWSKAAKEKAMDGSVPKGITVVRQNFVDRLFFLFNTITGEDPARNVAKGERYYEVSSFSRFVELCAEPVFGRSYNFSTQIRAAQEFHEEWLRAVPPLERPKHITEKDMEKICLKIERKIP